MPRQIAGPLSTRKGEPFMRHRIAVVGCGGMERTHESGLALLRDRVEIVATVDTVAERAERAAQILGARRWETDYRAVLDDVDAVLVVVPNHLHHELGMAALKAGKHVLMEKPLANTEQDCLELIACAEQENRVLMTAYPLRFHPLVLGLKQLVDDGTLGDVFQLSMWTEQLTHYAEGHWGNAAATLGGGQFFSHGCHYIDLLMWFLGEPVRGTHLGSRKGTPWMEGEGTSHVTIEFASGALGYHFGTWGARGSKLGYNMQAHGSEAMAEVDITNGELRLYSGDEVSVVLKVDPISKYVQGELAHFLDCIETGATPITNGPDSLEGLRLIWRLYEAEGRDVVADLRGLRLADSTVPA
jgi:predicted dehydrogenase